MSYIISIELSVFGSGHCLRETVSVLMPLAVVLAWMATLSAPNAERCAEGSEK